MNSLKYMATMILTLGISVFAQTPSNESSKKVDSFWAQSIAAEEFLAGTPINDSIIQATIPDQIKIDNALITFSENILTIKNFSTSDIPLRINVYSKEKVLEYIEYVGSIYPGSTLTQTISVLDTDFEAGTYIYVFESKNSKLARIFYKGKRAAPVVVQ